MLKLLGKKMHDPLRVTNKLQHVFFLNRKPGIFQKISKHRHESPQWSMHDGFIPKGFYESELGQAFAIACDNTHLLWPRIHGWFRSGYADGWWGLERCSPISNDGCLSGKLTPARAEARLEMRSQSGNCISIWVFPKIMVSPNHPF